MVRQMSHDHAEVNDFFTRYETALAKFDVAQIADCYADLFMFGGPKGVQCVKKEDFVKAFPKRKEFLQSRGLEASNIDSVEARALDSQYTFAKVIWKMRFKGSGSEPVYSLNAASYVLARTNHRFQIVFQIDHQDLVKKAEELVTA
jgi:hypothetical protein